MPGESDQEREKRERENREWNREYDEERARMREGIERRQRADEERESIAREEIAKIKDFRNKIECEEKELHEAHLLVSHNNVINASDQKKT